ncbi:MAG: hypothetical protein R3F65_08990 [bacterium]|nr:hypothetical protein [Myxococcales bacterium]
MSHPESPDDDRIDALLRVATRRAPAPELDPDDPTAPETIDDGALRAWRTGALDDEGIAAVDAALAESPADRALAREVARGAAPDASLYAWAEAQIPSARAGPTRRYAALALAATVLISAGVALWWRGGRPAPPAYVASALLGGAQTVRGEEAATARPAFGPNGRLIVRLRPVEATEPPPVRAFVARPGEPLRAIPAAVTPAPGGAMQVEVAAGVLGGQYGDWELFLALGEPDAPAEGRPFAEAREDGARWFAFAWRYVADEVPP